ncbi:hypothetical protein [Lysobacter niastensis]|uniref:Uncharacterized protein n=1 Tax=Lysobacter niastensis TaxID=380629 RepID=A0ABS0B628_9GAMM|nr:hypothetical protein [Lysobacter niastensis]MBF6024440.1 hypothetical protein [Lysobacter niastensis]
MYRVEVSHQDGRQLVPPIAEASFDFGTAEAALAQVLPQAKQWAESRRQTVWLRIYDQNSRVVFGTLLP